MGSVLSMALLWPVELIRATTRTLVFNVAKVKKLTKVGGWAILKIKGRHIIFVRDTEESIKALNSVCTHKQCTVEYDSKTQKIVCPCHGSRFHLDGKLLSPPARIPLKAYPASLIDGKVTITIEE
jgi:Rieske Fe-S protein